MNRILNALMASLLALTFVLTACAKKQANETPEQLKARKPAVYTAQGYVGLNAWSDLTETMTRNGVINAPSARTSYQENERARKILDVLSDRLQLLNTTSTTEQILFLFPNLTPEQAKKLSVIELLDMAVNDFQRIERAGVIVFSDPKAHAAFRSYLVSIRLGLVAIKSVLANKSEMMAQKGIQEALPDLIMISQDALIQLNNLSGASAEFAWKEARRLSAEIASKNAARLG